MHGHSGRAQPNLFIVGAPKCGTSSMRNYLDEHPEVFMAGGEPHFFGSDIPYNDTPMGFEEYLQLFAEADQEKVIGEKSTWYLYSKVAAAEIAEFDPNAKIIIHVRNPIEVVRSLHQHWVHKSARENICSLADALDAESERKKGRRIPPNARFPQHLFYTEIPKFTEQIKRYLDVFSWDQIHVVVFDDLVSDTEMAYKRVLCFLGLDEDYKPNFAQHNASVQRRCIWLHHLMKNKKIRRTLKCIVPRQVGRFFEKRVENINTEQKKHNMDAGLRDRLRSIFEPEVRRLSRLLDRDLTHWLADR